MYKIIKVDLLIIMIISLLSIVATVEANSEIIENTLDKNDIKIENIIEENTQTVDNEIYTENTGKSSQKETKISDIDISEISTQISKEEMIDLLNNQNDINISELSNGIWIEENSRVIVEKFINNHSSYTYSIDEKGYLNCDNKLRENKALEITEPAETEMDIGIRNLLNENKKIVLQISSVCYNSKDEKKFIVFDKDIYSKAYENNDIRIIYLNQEYYNLNNIEYNLVLSDNFLKTLDDIIYKVYIGEIQFLNENNNIPPEELLENFTDDGLMHGRANISQTVYHGPNNNGSYCTVGSIDRNEEIVILGAENNYYHILYAVTNSSNEKTGYVLKSNITKLSSNSVPDEVMTGGYRYANTSSDIKSRGLYSVAVSYGSVSNTEGITLLYDYHISYGSENYQVGFVEYWTGNGMKRGYIKMQYLSNPFTSTLKKVSSTKTTYTGPDSSRFTAGTGAIGTNEYVCVIGYTGNYIYIEYNTNSGRKRAFCTKTDLDISNPASLGIMHLPDMQINQGYISNSSYNISAGPGSSNSLCAYVGSIGENESVYRQTTSGITPYNQFNYTYIVYYAGNSLKGGFVPSSILTLAQNPSIPTLPTSVGQTGGFQQCNYWQSGLGNPIYTYKLGTGNKRLYLIYAQHGFEDEGYGDGVELVDVAYNFMEYMYTNRNDSNIQNILNNWTIYVVPYLNRDGITSGTTKDGPGRCTVTKQIDMNRNWPTAIYNSVLTLGRNYTGPTKLDTVEAQGLKNVLTSNSVKPVNGYTSILIDIHGWDCETIGNNGYNGIGNYYYQQFKNDSTTSFLSHSGTHAFQCRNLTSGSGSSGYLAQWAVENGIGKSIILEMPSHYNRTTGGRSLNDRFNTATINLLLGE